MEDLAYGPRLFIVPIMWVCARSRGVSLLFISILFGLTWFLAAGSLWLFNPQYITFLAAIGMVILFTIVSLWRLLRGLVLLEKVDRLFSSFLCASCGVSCQALLNSTASHDPLRITIVGAMFALTMFVCFAAFVWSMDAKKK